MSSYQYRKTHCGDRLISTMGFPILVRWHLYIESGPCSSLPIPPALVDSACQRLWWSVLMAGWLAHSLLLLISLMLYLSAACDNYYSDLPAGGRTHWDPDLARNIQQSILIRRRDVIILKKNLSPTESEMLSKHQLLCSQRWKLYQKHFLLIIGMVAIIPEIHGLNQDHKVSSIS